jgi:hypothetical protein
MDKKLVRNHFQKLFAQRGEEFDNLFTTIVLNIDSEILLDAAIEEFQEKGNQDRLDLVSRLLFAKGRSAIPTLQRIARTSSDWQSAFVSLIMDNNCLNREEKQNLVLEMLQSSDPDTVWKVYQYLFEY